MGCVKTEAEPVEDEEEDPPEEGLLNTLSLASIFEEAKSLRTMAPSVTFPVRRASGGGT